MPIRIIVTDGTTAATTHWAKLIENIEVGELLADLRYGCNDTINYEISQNKKRYYRIIFLKSLFVNISKQSRAYGILRRN